MQPAAWAVLVEVLIERAALDEAEGIVAAATGSSEVDSVCRSGGFCSRARLRLAQGQLPEAVADALRCGEQLDAFGYRNPALLPWRSMAAQAMLGIGNESARPASSPTRLSVSPSVSAHPERSAWPSGVLPQGLARGGAEGLAQPRARHRETLGRSPAQLGYRGSGR